MFFKIEIVQISTANHQSHLLYNRFSSTNKHRILLLGQRPEAFPFLYPKEILHSLQISSDSPITTL